MIFHWKFSKNSCPVFEKVSSTISSYERLNVMKTSQRNEKEMHSSETRVCEVFNLKKPIRLQLKNNTTEVIRNFLSNTTAFKVILSTSTEFTKIQVLKVDLSFRNV